MSSIANTDPRIERCSVHQEQLADHEGRIRELEKKDAQFLADLKSIRWQVFAAALLASGIGTSVVDALKGVLIP